MSSFGTILQRAEELKTDVKCGGLSKFNISHNAGMKVFMNYYLKKTNLFRN